METMADADVRREARRRRILENAQKRMEKITGRKENISVDRQDDPSKTLDNLDKQFLDLNGSVPSFAADKMFSSILQVGSQLTHRAFLPTPNSSQFAAGAAEIENQSNLKLLTNLTLNNEQEQQPTRQNKLFANKLVLVFLAIIVRFSHYFHLTQFFESMIFLPLILLEITDVTFMPGSNNESLGIISATLLLCGLPPKTVTTFTKCFNVLSKIIIDFSIFLFSFVLTHTVCSLLEMFFVSDLI